MNVSYLNRLRNQDFQEASRTICSTLERAEENETYLAEFLTKAQTELANLGFLKNMKRRHPLSKTIRELTLDRHDYIVSFKGKISNCTKSPDEKERNAGRVLDFWLERYREFLSKAKMRQQSVLTDQLSDDIQNDENVSQAMTDADLMTHFTSIKMITAEIRSVIGKRAAQRQKEIRKARQLRRNAYEAIKTLMNALDMAIKQECENRAAYVDYWNEICDTLDEYNAEVLSRATRRKTAAEKENENEQPIEGDVEGEDGNDVPEGDVVPTHATPKLTSVMRSRPYSAVRLGEHMDDDLQKFEEEHGSLTQTDDAMTGSVTNDDVSTSDEGKAAQADGGETDNVATNNATAGNGELTDDAQKSSTTEDDTTGHSDAKDSDLESSD